MNKIFLDCGSHLFQGFKEFVKILSIDKEWKCYSFEANPITYEMATDIHNQLLTSGFNLTRYNCAVLDKDDFVSVNCSEANVYDQSKLGTYTGQGSNVLKNPPNFSYTENLTKVRSINLSNFIKYNFSKKDYIAIKMDIEGSEFDVLDRLILDNVIEYVDEIYIEFHERFFDDQLFYLNKKEEYKKLFLEKGIKFFEWY